jgi:hypothetical protein
MSYKGKFRPKNPEKYIGKVDKIVYRSYYELKFFRYCDRNSSIRRWASEEVVVPYRSPIDNEVHRYFTDVYVEKIENGELVKRLIEIKPSSQVTPPKKQKRKTKRYINEMKTWVINDAKWKAAKAYAENRGWIWTILTEKELKIGKK